MPDRSIHVVVHLIRRVTLVILVAVVIAASILPAYSQTNAPGADDCFELGRTFGGGSWSPDSSEFVFASSDRSTTRLESISFPGMERRVLAEAIDPWSSFDSPTFTDDGWVLVGSTRDGVATLTLVDPTDPSRVTDVPGAQLDRAWFMFPQVAHGDTAIVSVIDIIGSGDLLHRINLMTGRADAIELPAELEGRSIRWVSAPADGSFLLLGLDDPSGARHDWWVLRDGSATPLDYGVDVFWAWVSDDGSRIFYTANDGSDPDGVHSVAIAGSDPRVEFRRSDVDEIAVSGQGIAAFAGRISAYDGAPPVLPEPPESRSSTPTSALCFARTSLAALDVAYLDELPPDDTVAEVVFPAVPDTVLTTIASLPRAIEGLRLVWESGAYAEGEPQPLRVTSLQAFTLAMLATVSADLDPESVWADRATLVGADGMPVNALLSLITDGVTPGSTWVQVVRRELTARDAGASTTETTLASRGAVVVEGLRDVVLPDGYDQSPAHLAAIRNYWWPETSTYLVPSGTALYIISTDDRALAEAVAVELGA